MSYNNFKNILIIIVLSFILNACADKAVKPVTSDINTNDQNKNSASKADKELYRDGITALHNNELSKSQRFFNEFIRKNPKLAGGYSNLALMHFKKKEYQKSLKQVNKAIELNAKQAQAYNLRAQLYVINGKIHEAKADYLKAVELKPKYINAQYNLALLYDVYLQEIQLAINHYKTYMLLLKEPDEATKEWISHLEGTLKND